MEDILGEPILETLDTTDSWPVKLLAKAINNMTKLRDLDRTMCEILDTTMSVISRGDKFDEVSERLTTLIEELDLCQIEYTKPSLEELTYSLNITYSLFCGKNDDLEEFTQLFGWDLSDYEYCKDQGNSLKGFAISFLRFG